MVMPSYAVGVMEMSVMWVRTIPMLLKWAPVSLTARILSYPSSLLSVELLFSCIQSRSKWYIFQKSVLFCGSHQLLLVTQQLNDGIRLLQMQALNQGGTIRLCHTSCVWPLFLFFLHNLNIHFKSLLDGGTLQDYLSIGIYNFFLVKVILTIQRS